MSYFKSSLSAVVLAFSFSLVATGCLFAQDWSSFRGSGGTSVSSLTNLPVEISDEKNLAWKVELPGRGPSSPIVIGDKVVVTCSGGAKEDQLYVVCIDANSGDKIWQRRFWATGRCFCHPLSANAAPTPCTDGKFIYALYSSNDLICLDMEGNLKWCRGLAVDHPKAGHDTGMSSSPAVHGDVVICQVENQGDSFATGINRLTGETIWEIPRDADASWSSPIIFQADGGKPMCLLTSTARSTIVDVKTGEKVWEKEGEGNPIPSSSVVGNRIYIPINGLTVVEFGTGDEPIKEVFNSTRLSASTSSNVVDGNNIYTFARGGIMACSDVNSGEEAWKVRVGGSHWTTPLVANGHMYFFAQDGAVSVVQLTGEFEDDADRVIHTHTFDEEVFLGSPAAAKDAIFMRSDKFLYRFSKGPV